MATTATNYEEFDPTTETVQKKDGAETILLYVPGFTKGQLRVQFTPTNQVRISGEKESEGGKSLRFQKEFPVKPKTDTNGISAKFEKGILQIKLPQLNDQQQESEMQKTGKESDQLITQRMATAATKYEEFDPTTETMQEKDGETILLYLPGFTKGQLRVQFTSTNQVRISGEKESEDSKSLRFLKEFPVKPKTDTNGISAKFENGILQVKLPQLNDQQQESEMQKTMDFSGKESDQLITQTMASAATKYEEFDPTTETVQEKDGEIILLYVPGFTKGQLRVQFTSTNQLRISGEKESEGGKSLRFRKEFPVKPKTDTNGISAKFEKGILQVKLPQLNDQQQESEMQKITDFAGKESDQLINQTMATTATKYEEFDPTTETVLEKDGETILLYVPGFTKGQLRVQFTSTNQVRISGEKESEGGKSLRFRKEFPVKPKTDTNAISAKFEKGILQVKLPKLNDQQQESEMQKTTNFAGKESDQVSDQKKFDDDTRNARNVNVDKGNATTLASSEIGQKLSKIVVYAVLVVLVVVSAGLYSTNVEKCKT